MNPVVMMKYPSKEAKDTAIICIFEVISDIAYPFPLTQ